LVLALSKEEKRKMKRLEYDKLDDEIIGNEKVDLK